MMTRFVSFIVAHYIFLTRSFIVGLGCFAIWWGTDGFPVFWKQISGERIAGQVLAGYSFRNEILVRQLQTLNESERASYCRPIALRSAAIIQLRIVEAAAPANNRGYDREVLKPLGDAIRRSLSCEPADPFLWLVLYGVESTQNGFKSEYLAYLRMSYRLGKNEAWIALRRNPVAFADFERLSADLATDAIDEFLALLKDEFYVQAVEIFSGPAWRLRNAVIPHLSALSRRNREAFIKAAQDKGLAVTIPGGDVPNSQPSQ